MHIKISNLYKRYPNGYEALKNVNLEFKQGEFVAFIGLSGAGKTTLLKTINGLNPVTAGQINVGKFQVDKLSTKMMQELRKSVGIIFQGYNLVQQSNVLKNTYNSLIPDMPWFRRYLGFPNCAEKNKALTTLGSLKILRWAYTRADQLSGGQMQRVALAKTITQNPRIVLADEPVAALDPLMLKSVMDDFKRVNNTGVTVIANLHHVEVALKYADRIIGIKDGEIIYDGLALDVNLKILKSIYGNKLKGITAKTIKMALSQKPILKAELEKEDLHKTLSKETLLEAKIRMAKSKPMKKLRKTEKKLELYRIALNLQLTKLIAQKKGNNTFIKAKILFYLKKHNEKTNLQIDFQNDDIINKFLRWHVKRHLQLFSRINDLIIERTSSKIAKLTKIYQKQFQKEFLNEIFAKIEHVIAKQKKYIQKLKTHLKTLECKNKEFKSLLKINGSDKNIIKSLFINRQIKLYNHELQLTINDNKRLKKIQKKELSKQEMFFNF